MIYQIRYICITSWTVEKKPVGQINSETCRPMSKQTKINEQRMATEFSPEKKIIKQISSGYLLIK